MNKYQNFFEDYTKQYNLSEWAFGYKHDHTLRVAKICRDIAESLKLPKKDVDLAELVGLFHDIGRFEQWQQGENFNDGKTFDHGAKGVEILEQTSILDQHPDKNLILVAVDNHNKLIVDPKIKDQRTLIFCKIVRDADKIDIIKSLLNGKIGQGKLVVARDAYSPEALQFFKNHQPVDRKICPSEADRALTSLSLFFDINFKYSKQYICKHQLIQKLTGLYIKLNPEQEEFFRELEQEVLSVY